MIIETLIISSVLSALGKSDIIKNIGAKAASYIAPKFMKKLNSKLKSAVGLDVEGILSKKFNKILEETVPDKKTRDETKKKLVKIFSKMLKEQKFDEETFLELCAEYDLNRDFCEFLWTDFYETLRNLMISVIEGNDKLLQKTLLGLSYDIKADTTAIKGLIVDLRQDVLILKDEIINALKKDKVIVMPTDVVLERMIPSNPKLFRLGGYLWVDYAAGYVVLREDKYKELVWAARQGKRFLLIKGQPASGKTTFIREVLWRLSNSGIDAWYIDSRLLKMYNLDRVMDELRDIKNTWIIIDDAFFATKQVKEIIDAIRRDPSMNNILVIVTREGLENIFSGIAEETILLKGEEIAEKIILNFARIVNMKITQSDIDVIKGLSKGNLWILAFALETFYKYRFLNQKLLVKLALETFKREFQNIFTSILEINEATLLCSAIAFLQSNGISPNYEILLKILNIEKHTLTQLLDVGILRLVTSNTIAIFHDAQADLLRRAVANENDLMRDLLVKVDPKIPPVFRSLMSDEEKISEDILTIKLTLLYLVNFPRSEQKSILELIKEKNVSLYEKLLQLINLIERQENQKFFQKEELPERLPSIKKAQEYGEGIRRNLAIETKQSLFPYPEQTPHVILPKGETEKLEEKKKEKEEEKVTKMFLEVKEEKEPRIPRVTIHSKDLEEISVSDPSIFVDTVVSSLIGRIPVFTEREKLVPLLTDLWLRDIRINIPFQVMTPIYKTILALKNKLLSNENIDLHDVDSSVISTKPILEELTLIGILTGNKNLIPSLDGLQHLNFDRLVKRLLLVNARCIDILEVLGNNISTNLFIKLALRAYLFENTSLKSIVGNFSENLKLALLAIAACKNKNKSQKIRSWINKNIKQKIIRLQYESILVDDVLLLEELLTKLKDIPNDYALDIFEILTTALGYKNLLFDKDFLSLILGFISEVSDDNIATKYKLNLLHSLTTFRPVKLTYKLINEIMRDIETLKNNRSITLKIARLSGIMYDLSLLNEILSYQKKSIDMRTIIEESLLSAFIKI